MNFAEVAVLGDEIVLLGRIAAKVGFKIKDSNFGLNRSEIEICRVIAILSRELGRDRIPMSLVLLEELAPYTAAVPPVKEVRETFLAYLRQARSEEINRGVILVGPHRDDFHFLVNGIDMTLYGSRGQQRTAVLALKLAEVHWMREQINDWPILLLDEVMAELDVHRRSFLLGQINGANQCVLTATDPEMFTVEFRAQARLMRVTRGRVET